MPESPTDRPVAPTAQPPATPTQDWIRDPAYRDAVVDLLGVISYGEVCAFERLADDAKMAPDLPARLALSAMAAAQYDHLSDLHDRIRELGGDPFAAMAPFQPAIDDFHDHTRPSDWHEGLIKAYVGDGLAADFYREISEYLDVATHDVIVASLVDEGHAEFVVERVRGAIDAEPRLAGRLALWGRRLMGEALLQAQRVAAERDALTALLVGGVDRPGMDLAEIGKMFTRLTERHTERMGRLGLDP